LSPGDRAKIERAGMRIGIFTTADAVWALPTWARTIPALQERHQVVGLYLFPHRITGAPGFETWQQLAATSGLELRCGESPNADEPVAWLQEAEIDVLFIMVGEILTPRTLAAARVAVVNKHASILPSARGLFPYFWGRLKGLPTGISFHAVDEGIDTGPILVQERYPPNEDAGMSMLRFYIDAYARYLRLALAALEQLETGGSVAPPADVAPSYFGFPTRADHAEFRRGSHAVAPDEFDPARKSHMERATVPLEVKRRYLEDSIRTILETGREIVTMRELAERTAA